jgi:hypothetical protein
MTRFKTFSPLMETKKPKPIPAHINFLTAGMGGVAGWCVVHPFNTAAVCLDDRSIVLYLLSISFLVIFISLYGLGTNESPDVI